MNQKDFFTLSYDDKTIKVLQIKSGDSVCIREAELRSGIVSNGKILRKESFAESLKVVLNGAKPEKITAKYVVVALPESKVFIKILEIPKISDDKIQQAISWQAESLLPVAPEHLYLDWQRIAETPQGKIKILITACPKDIIDSLIEALQIIKLTPMSIKSKAGSLAGLFSRAQHKPILIVNIESEETSLIIAKNNVSRVSTSIDTGKDIAILKSKIAETIDFYENKKGEKKVEEVVITGIQETDKLQKLIEKSVALPVKVGRYPDEKIKIKKQEELSYLVNLGLAYNPLEGVNLLPQEIKHNIQIDKLNQNLVLLEKISLSVAVILLFLLGIIYLVLIFDYDKTKKILASASLYKISPKAQEVDNTIQDLNKRLIKIDGLQNQRSSYSGVLQTISGINQDGVKVTEFMLDNETGKFKIGGVARYRSQLLEYREKMYQDELFKDIAISLKSLEKPENINFELYFSIK